MNAFTSCALCGITRLSIGAVPFLDLFSHTQC